MPGRFLSTAAALCAGLALAAAPAGSRAASIVTYCIEAAPEGFDIAQYEAGTTFDAVGITIYDTLTLLRLGGSDIVPGLAESWTTSPDGLTVTMKLRPNVKFHTTAYFKPTRDFNADDVLFSFQRLYDKGHWAHDLARNGYIYWEGMGMSQLVKSVEKVDPLTVRFTLTRPEAPFIADVSIAALAPILSLEYAEQLRRAGKLEQLNIQPIGTGPFAFRSYQKDAVLRLASNKDYWGGAPKFDQLVLAITVDSDVAVQRVKAGECLGAPIKNEAAARFDGDTANTIITNKPLQTLYVAPNDAKGITANEKFREALWYAIDKPNYIKAAYNGAGDIAASFLPPDMWSYDATLRNRYDLDRSRALLKQSGYDGSELGLWLNEDPVIRRAAELLQADWARVGVKVRLMSMEQGELFRRTGKGEHDIALLRWGSDNADPDNFFTPNLSCSAVAGGGNKSRYCSKAFDAVIDEARKTSDLAKRTVLYRKAQKMIYDEVPVIPLIYPVRTFVISKRVTGYLASPMQLHDFRAVSVQ